MNHGLIAPQFGLAAKRFAEGVRDSSHGQPTTATAVAYAGSSTFRPNSGPAVVVKTIKRRRLEFVAAANGAGVAPRDSSMENSSPDRGQGLKASKVFRLSPSRPATPIEDNLQPELSAEEKLGADSSDSKAASTSSSSTSRRRRRRDPVTVPVLVRHVVFNSAEAEEPRESDLQTPSVSEQEASYESVMSALRQLCETVEALTRARELIAELDVATRSLRADEGVMSMIRSPRSARRQDPRCSEASVGITRRRSGR